MLAQCETMSPEDEIVCLAVFTDSIEQIREKCMVDGDWGTPLCAWCLSEQGIAALEGSHGICREHADQILLQQRKLRRRQANVG